MPAPSASGTAAWVIAGGVGFFAGAATMSFFGIEKANEVHHNVIENSGEEHRLMADALAGLVSSGINLAGFVGGTLATRFFLWVGNFGLSACNISPCPTGCPGSSTDEERRPLV